MVDKIYKILQISFAIVMFSNLSVFAGVFYVRPDGSDSNSGSANTYQDAWATIQKAADTLRPGDIVEVQAGTYYEAVKVIISGESARYITYRANGQVIIDGQNTRPYCVKLEGVNFIKVDGFTLINSTGSGVFLDRANYNLITKNTSRDNLSQGIKLNNFSTFNTLSANILYNNKSGSNALGDRNCGIYLYNYSNGNSMDNNTAYSNGTGICLEGASSGCTISNNKTYSNGWGGLLLAGSANNNIVSCNLSYSNSAFGLEVSYSANSNLIKNNVLYSNSGNGIQLNFSAINNTVKNNIIANNGPSSSVYYGIYIETGSSSAVSYNDIFNNGYGGNNKYGGVAAGTNDISLNPIFKSTASSSPDFLKISSRAKGDAQDSPCIDAGNPSDVASNGSGQRVDIGAYDLYTLRPQATYYVKPNGNDLSDGRTIATAWATIQKAANAVNPLDIVEVQAGTYNEQVIITRSGVSGKLITFRANGQVIIDGQSIRPYCIKLDGADYVKIEGFTIRNATDNGILLINSANYNVLSNNTCHNNGASGIRLNNTSNYNTLLSNTCYSNGSGASAYGDRPCGIYLFNSSNYNTLDSNICRNNPSTGIWLEGSSSYCALTNNKAYSNGWGGIIVAGGTNYNTVSYNLIYSNGSMGVDLSYSAHDNLFNNNTIYNNGANGIQSNNAAYSNTLKNNIVFNNGLNSSSAYGINMASGCSATSVYNNVYNNGQGANRNYSGLSAGPGEISLDPLFKSTTSTDPNFLKLRSIAAGDALESPCIDSGSPSDTPSAQSGKRIDIGAYDLCSHSPIEGGLLAEYFDNQDLTSLKLVRIDPRINFDWGSSSPDASIGVDTFSVRWQGQVRIDFAETYTFYVITDDGSRLWIDNKLIIDKWFNQGQTEYRAALSLTPGFHDIKYEYYDSASLAIAKFYWSSSSISKSLIPSDHLYYFAALPQDNYIQGGLKGRYYKPFNVSSYDSPLLCRIDPQINFDWGSNMPDAALGWDSYQAKWNGKIKIDKAETYAFYTTSDDGERLWVNDRLIIDAWYDHGAAEHQGNIYLAPGLYDIELNYYENGGGAVCKLSYSSPYISKRIIPPANLYYENERYSIDGLYAQYFDDMGFTSRKIKKVDAKIDYDWIFGSPDPLIQPDTFSVRWTGQVKVDNNETYSFCVTSDDGFKLWVDNVLVINNWFDKWAYESTGNIYLTQGWHDIQIEYYENRNQEVIKLAYSSPSTLKTIIPQDHLRSNQPRRIAASNLICHLESRDDIQNPTIGHSGVIVETGAGKLTFVPAKFNQGVELNGANLNREGIKLSTNDLSRKEGTIAFWFKPNWNSDDGKSHYFFTNTWDLNGCVQAFKYSNNAIYWKIVKDGVQHVIVSDTARKWSAGEGHDLAFSYGPSGMNFYLDGDIMPISWTFGGELPYKGPLPDNFSSGLYFGETDGGYDSINAVVDELVISKIQEAPDVIAPSVSIFSPADNKGFTSQPITVMGTVDDADTEVYVNSVEVAVSNGTFTAGNVPLVLGRNTVIAKAVDKWGNNGLDSITVFYDLSEPSAFTVTDDGEYTNSITRLHATWTQSLDAESGIAEYKYAIGTTKGATDTAGWTSAGLNTEVTRTALNLTEGQKYFFSVKAINGAGKETVCYSDGIIADITAPVISITSHTNNQPLTTQPITVGGRIDDNNARVTVNGVEAYVSNGTFISEGISLQLGQYEIVAVAVDLAGNSSQDSKTVIFDNSAPTLPLIIDDGDFTNKQTKLHAAWSSYDAESGITEYRYSIGTAAGAADVAPWTSTGLTSEVTHEGLVLSIGQIYYFNVKAKNGVGLESVSSSDGIIVKENDPPAITGIEPSPLSGHVQDNIGIVVNARDIDKDNLLYRFSVDNSIIQAWQSGNSCNWQTGAAAEGAHSLKVEIDDGMGAVISRTNEIWLFRKPPSSPD